MTFDPTKQLSQKAKDSIEGFWAGANDAPSTTNPEGLEDFGIDHLFPTWIKDARGVRWDMDMTYIQPDLDNNQTRVLFIRYTSAPSSQQSRKGDNYHIVLDLIIQAGDFAKLTDHTYVMRRMKELEEMVEDNVAKVKAQAPMVVDKPVYGGKP